MLDDYKKAVISSYLEKKERKLLSSNLIYPTPGQLRDESLLVLHSRPDIKDEKIIRDFFNLGAESNNYIHSIRRFDVDKLRPLAKMMRAKIEDTGIKNIELLAWLIDFEPRPYQYGVLYFAEEQTTNNETKHINEDQEISDEEEIDEEITEVSISPVTISTFTTTKTSTRLPLNKYGIDLIIFLITMIGGIGLSMRNANIEKSTTAYICTSKVAKKYHLNAKCHGLNNCKSKIISTTIAGARKGGKTRCEIEH